MIGDTGTKEWVYSINRDTPLNTFSNTLVYVRSIAQNPSGMVLVLIAGHCS